jgi:AraC-like DNA-binding protein
VRFATFLGLAPEELLELNGFSERKARLESVLLAAVSQPGSVATEVVSHAVRQINRRSGDIRMRDLAASCNLSERQLERLFLDKVGIAPTLYARIRRFRSVLDCLEDPGTFEPLRLADLAAEYGYTDQSHMARDFRNFSHNLILA